MMLVGCLLSGIHSPLISLEDLVFWELSLEEAVEEERRMGPGPAGWPRGLASVLRSALLPLKQEQLIH